MHINEVFTTGNKCYQVGAPLRPQGLMLHSIGTPQPSAAALARYFDQYQPGGQSYRQTARYTRRCRGRCAAGIAAARPTARTSAWR